MLIPHSLEFFLVPFGSEDNLLVSILPAMTFGTQSAKPILRFDPYTSTFDRGAGDEPRGAAEVEVSDFGLSTTSKREQTTTPDDIHYS